MANERLYIKVILPKQGEEKRVPAGGGEPKPFKDVTPALRHSLLLQLGKIEATLKSIPVPARVVPARVTLEEKAIAKSHRPDVLFNKATCPIIGAGKPGELFVKATPRGLRALQFRIESGFAPQVKKAISTLHNISPISTSDRLSGVKPSELFNAAPAKGGRRLLKVHLFDFGDRDDQDVQIHGFEDLLAGERIQFERLQKFGKQYTYLVRCRTSDDVSVLANAVMVRRVDRLPVFRTLRNMRLNPRPLPASLCRIGRDPRQFPVVGVVDSGVTRDLPALQDWVHAREPFVADAEANTAHGTFVAGLLVWGHELNSSLTEVGAHPCRVLDVHVLPNSDPSRGPVGFINELELLQALEDCLQRYANDVKVWNLSLGSDELCRLDRFSDFAVALDNLQEEYGVTFVIAAGNYQQPPLLQYPRSDKAKERGRITSPADSVLGVTVASVAQLDHPSDGSKRGEPSPFSRNGPGPNYVIKPDLAHFGGNIGLDGSHPLGISSVSDEQTVGEDVGTSFSAPLVARQLAYVHHSIVPSPSTTLARAILTHNARDLRTGGRVQDGDDHYIGFGTPGNVDRALECSPWMTTLVFEETLRPGYFLEWDYFPYPTSLTHGNKFRGEIWMTLAFPPRRNPQWGSEYCETHVEAHFGVYRNDKEGEEGFHGLIPPEHNNVHELYEKFQVEKLRKWAPVRTYYKRIPSGVSGLRWRLKVGLLSRHPETEQAPGPQPFALLLTIADPERTAPVYDEMAQSLHARFQARNLRLRPTVRIESRT
jgi:serine protease AprX